MSTPKSVAWLYWFAALLFLAAALVPIARGENLNATFLVVAIVFLILGIGKAKRSENHKDAPPDK
jgi:hypothetical protein